MPRTIGRDLNLCFIKIKSPLAICNSSSSDTDDRNRPCATTNSRTRTSASANSCSSILIKNFNSLYDNTVANTSNKSLTTQTSSSLSNTSIATASTSSHEPEPEPDPQPEPDPSDFASAFASKRFFFSSPGRSNSIIESTSSNLDCCIYSSSTSRSSAVAVTLPYDRNEKLVIDNSVVVHTYSPDPYVDFRRSMQDMVEARASTDTLMDVKSQWEFLHDLLLCYLALNPHNTHKFIIGAFADLLVSLMSSQDKTEDNEMAVNNGCGGE